jgi:RecA-family ATPase
MLVGNAMGDPTESPEKILADVKSMEPEGMLQRYHDKRSQYQPCVFDTDGKYFRFLRGEWSIISGYTGSGKTTAIRQQICSILRSGSGVFTASLEQDPEDFVVQLAAVAAGNPDVTERELQWFLQTYGDRLRVWNVTEHTDHRILLATIRSLAAKGFKHAFIDSLMCVDIEVDDWEGQKRFAELVRATAIATRGHIYLVAHPRKPSKAGQIPDVSDIAGTSAIGNLAFNVLFVRRGESESMDADSNPIQMLIRKQRTLGTVGELNAWYHRKLGQITLNKFSAIPVRYLPDEAYPPAEIQEAMPDVMMATQRFKPADVQPGWEE